MLLDPYYQEQDGDIRISPEQASNFAKQVAGDFNPLHDADASRFCVPGDLLFSLVLAKYGLSQKMCFRFKGMVGDGRTLQFSPTDAESFTIMDAQGKEYMTVEREGQISHDQQLIGSLTQNYVAFSAQAFPTLLVPLLSEQGVMINPDRPLVIYESMSIDLQHLDISDPQLVQGDAELEVNGKRGELRLAFEFMSDGEVVGHGVKRMLLSGLKPYDAGLSQGLIDRYYSRKASFEAG